MKIYLKPCEPWTNSAFNSQEDCCVHFICSYYSGTRAKLSFQMEVKNALKNEKCQQGSIRHSLCIYHNSTIAELLKSNLARNMYQLTGLQREVSATGNKILSINSNHCPFLYEICN